MRFDMKSYVNSGDSVEVAAPYDVLSGAGCLVGTLFGIAFTDALSGALVTLKTKGVYDHAKNSAEAWTVGAAVYWDNSAKVFTTTTTSNTKCGVAVAVAANPSAVGRVRLNEVTG
jgi:predicted RecA/RadA family phage recombinase